MEGSHGLLFPLAVEWTPDTGEREEAGRLTVEIPANALMRRILATPCPVGHAGVNGACFARELELLGSPPGLSLFVCLERVRAAGDPERERLEEEKG